MQLISVHTTFILGYGLSAHIYEFLFRMFNIAEREQSYSWLIFEARRYPQAKPLENH
jgi:hypothetical protein